VRRDQLLVCLAIALTLLAPVAAGAVSPSEGPAATAPVQRSDLRDLVHRISTEQGVDPRLVHALVVVESGYQPRAVSPKGALGLTQLMPATAQRLHVKNPFDPEQNVRAGVRELSRLIDRYAGDLPRALAAYNAGEGAVDRYRGVPPYRETRRYVQRILSLYFGRPYHLDGRPYRQPVKLVRDPRTGSVVITNGGVSSLVRPGAIRLSSGGGTLGGGFGR